MDSLSPDDIQSIVANAVNGPVVKAAGSIDENPERGARALQLAQSTGLPPNLVYADLDNIDREHKTDLTAGIVRNSPVLQAYINNNPLADVVSNDDYGALSNVMSTLGRLYGDNYVKAVELEAQSQYKLLTDVLMPPVKGAIEGVVKGVGPSIPGSWAINTEFGQRNPYSAVAWATLGMPIELGVRAIGGFAGGVTGGLQGGAKGLFAAIGQEAPSNLLRDIEGGVENYFMGGGGGTVHAATQAQAFVARIERAKRAAKPWTDAGLEPPRGIDPFIDEFKTRANEEGLNRIEAALAAAENSSTRARAPEMFRAAVEEQVGNDSISISGDAIAALYKDKLPASNDGILGWIPDFENQLRNAIDTGEDIRIPLKDWLTYSTPEVRQVLRQDTRLWDGGITAREAAEAASPKEVVDSPLAQIRANGLEPMFAWGDRKISLKKGSGIEGFEHYNEFQLLDQNGRVVGDLTLVPDPATKTLHIEMIGGAAGHWANSFGPSLVRDLMRQLKAEFPDYEYITGHRVTGAREGAGTTGETHAFPKVKFDEILNPASFNNFNRIMSGTVLKNFHPEVTGGMKPRELYTKEEASAHKIISDILGRIAPKAESYLVHGIQSGGREALGTFIPSRERAPQVLVNFFSPNPGRTARHEGLHVLRNYGFLSESEWGTLQRAAVSEGWLNRYNIHQRYENLSDHYKLEESVADAYGEWAQNRENRVDSPVGRIFQKLEDLWNEIKAQIKSVLGKEPDFNTIFRQIESGEVGAREPAGFADRGGYRLSVDESKSFDYSQLQAQLDSLQASAIKLDVKSFKRLQELLKERYREDIEASAKSAEREAKRKLTPEWNERIKETRAEVEETIKQRPDVAADLFIGSGEYKDKQTGRKRIPLRASDLSAEEKSMLPRWYYSNDGIPVEPVAQMFGFGSGKEMVEALKAYHEQKGDLSAQQMVKKIIDMKTAELMEARYGKLAENIATEAHDIAFSENAINLLSEEYTNAALLAKQTPVDLADIKAEAKRIFDSQTASGVNYSKLVSLVEKHASEAERALIADKPEEAVISMGRRLLTSIQAAEARKLEKEIKQLDRFLRTHRRRVVEGEAPEYTNYIHQAMMKVGAKVNRTFEDLKLQMEGTQQKDFKTFVENKQAQGHIIDIWDALTDPAWTKPLDQLTVQELRWFKDSVKVLEHLGRDELKIDLLGEKMDRAVLIDTLVNQLEHRDPIKYTPEGERVSFIPGMAVIRSAKAAHLQLETVFNRFAKFDSKGEWNKVIYNLIDAANARDALKRSYANKIRDVFEALEDKNFDRVIPNKIWKQPGTSYDFSISRGNMLMIMLNSGTKQNREKMAGGYGVTVPQMMNWLNEHATKSDWAFAEGMWGVMREFKTQVDIMYRGMTGGVAPETVQGLNFYSKHGPVKGGYWPIIEHSVFKAESGELRGPGDLFDQGYINAYVSNGYTKSRTKDIRPLSMSLDEFPARFDQMIHDLAMRPAVTEARKIFFDNKIFNGIQRQYGNEYAEMLRPYLIDVANSSLRDQEAIKGWRRWSEFIRQNTISTLIAFNPGTVMKHGPTALVMSMHEVGVGNFLRETVKRAIKDDDIAKAYDIVGGQNYNYAVRTLFEMGDEIASSNGEFALKHSLELQRRHPNWQETLYGTMENQMFGKGFQFWRHKVMEWGATPVSFADNLSAVPTWLAKYREQREAGYNHEEAVIEGDRAVRRAHGSTATTNRTSVQRNANPWLTSVYNFFSDIFNRMVETGWKAGETYDLFKEGDFKDATKTIPMLTAAFFAYAVFPAVNEELVSPLPHGKDEDLSWTVAKATGKYLSAGVIGLRDLVSGLSYGRDPQFGLLGSMAQNATNWLRDLRKDNPVDERNAGKLVQDMFAVMGTVSGMAPLPIGKAARFSINTNLGYEDPEGPWSWVTGLRYGTLKKHSHTWDDWIGGDH
jgi:hypothetical protein